MRSPPLLAAWLLLIAAVGCREGVKGSPSNRAESFVGQTLRVSSFPGYLVPEVTRSFEEHTGAKLLIESYPSNEDLIARIEGGAQVDVIFPSGYNNADGHGYLFFVNPRTGALLEPPVATGFTVGS